MRFFSSRRVLPGLAVLGMLLVFAATSAGNIKANTWTSADIGTAFAGTTSTNASNVTIQGSGADIGASSDGFRYAFNQGSGGVEISVKITAWDGAKIDGWSKAGLMIRNSTAPNAANMTVVVTGKKGLQAQWRGSDGGITYSAVGPATFSLPIWLKLTKTSNSARAFYSTNGSTWTQIGGSQSIYFSDTVLYGMAVTARREGAFATATFHNPRVSTWAQTHMYYVDCGAGNDNNAGTSANEAWKSLNKANQAALVPGAKLLFKRGCTWSGRVSAGWNGTEAQRITIGAYGTGTMPVIQDDPTRYANVFITGSYQIVENLHATLSAPPNPDPNCSNQPVGGYWAGFNLDRGAHHNLVRNSKATRMTMGVNISVNSHHNQILNNTFTENNALETLTPQGVNAHDDKGAWGVLLHGSDNEIAYNYFANNRAICTYDTGIDSEGNSIELYEAVRNMIHHNISVNDRVFSEMGSSAAVTSADNVYAYNLVRSNLPTARFLVTRGAGHPHGPVLRTTLYNNTAYYTGNDGQAVVCQNCGTDVLTLRNNILWANGKALYAAGPLNESNNVYWSANGSPVVQLLNGAVLSAYSKLANPQFVNLEGADFHLKSSSPAVNSGNGESLAAGFGADLDGVPVPQGGGVDAGAYEFR